MAYNYYPPPIFAPLGPKSGATDPFQEKPISVNCPHFNGGTLNPENFPKAARLLNVFNWKKSF